MQEHGQENTYRTPLQKWVDALHIFDDDVEKCEKEDDALYLIKQYARLQLSSTKQLRADYKQILKKKCPEDLLRNEIILSILSKIQNDLAGVVDPNLIPVNMNPIDFNTDAIAQASRGSITRLAEGTVLERAYNGKIYVIFRRKDFYEYKRKRYDSLTEIAREITGTLCSGPTFFSRKVKMYLLREY